MNNLEPKKLALLRILQILEKYSDERHQLTQNEIAEHLYNDYGISIERKAISRNVSLLRDAGFEIKAERGGIYLQLRDFEDSELRLLIDGILSSKYICANHSEKLIEKLCGLSNMYFRSHVKNIYSVNDWSKTDNQELFLNIELIDSAIEKGLRIGYDYNKIGVDKKLRKSSYQIVSPYQLILHNQRYYLMAYSEYWENIVYHRLDRITNMKLTDEKATRLRSLRGYENGIDYKKLSSSMPYMYADEPERIELAADIEIIDQLVDWFGTDIVITAKPDDEKKVNVQLTSSPYAMEHWAMQYINFIEIISPETLREKIRKSLKNGMQKYELPPDRKA